MLKKKDKKHIVEPTRVSAVPKTFCEKFLNVILFLPNLLAGVKKRDTTELIIKKYLFVVVGSFITLFFSTLVSIMNRTSVGTFIGLGFSAIFFVVGYVIYIILGFPWIYCLTFVICYTLFTTVADISFGGNSIILSNKGLLVMIPMVVSGGFTSWPVTTISIVVFVGWNVVYFVIDAIFDIFDYPTYPDIKNTKNVAFLIYVSALTGPIALAIISIIIEILNQQNEGLLIQLCFFIISRENNINLKQFKRLRKIKNKKRAYSEFERHVKNAIMALEEFFKNTGLNKNIFYTGSDEEDDSKRSKSSDKIDEEDDIEVRSINSLNSRNSSLNESEGSFMAVDGGKKKKKKNFGKGDYKELLLEREAIFKSKINQYQARMMFFIFLEFFVNVGGDPYEENVNDEDKVDKLLAQFISRRVEKYKGIITHVHKKVICIAFVVYNKFKTRQRIKKGLDFICELREYLQTNSRTWKSVLAYQLYGECGIQWLQKSNKFVYDCNDFSDTDHIFRSMQLSGKNDLLMLMKPVDDDLNNSSTITVTYDYDGISHDCTIDYGKCEHTEKDRVLSCFSIKKISKKKKKNSTEWANNVPEEILNKKDKNSEKSVEHYVFDRDINFFKAKKESSVTL